MDRNDHLPPILSVHTETIIMRLSQRWKTSSDQPPGAVIATIRDRSDWQLPHFFQIWLEQISFSIIIIRLLWRWKTSSNRKHGVATLCSPESDFLIIRPYRIIRRSDHIRDMENLIQSTARIGDPRKHWLTASWFPPSSLDWKHPHHHQIFNGIIIVIRTSSGSS